MADIDPETRVRLLEDVIADYLAERRAIPVIDALARHYSFMDPQAGHLRHGVAVAVVLPDGEDVSISVLRFDQTDAMSLVVDMIGAIAAPGVNPEDKELVHVAIVDHSAETEGDE